MTIPVVGKLRWTAGSGDRKSVELSWEPYYRVATDVLQQMFPVDAGKDVETLRRRVLKVSEVLRNDVTTKPDMAAQAITVRLDSTFIRSCEEDERHLEVRVGNVETASGGRQVFGAVAKADTDIKVLIRRSLDAVGRSENTVLSAFTAGCSGLRRIRRGRCHRGGDARLVPHRHAAAAPRANRRRPVGG